ncbi:MULTISPECIES: hypothetical protein [Nocardia]|uniref:hypothetical protein n=1 Tax=Nocardia TaxID=1817 RepID=UPI001C216241|nr:hypothetical protein [Nocardia noduli]
MSFVELDVAVAAVVVVAVVADADESESLSDPHAVIIVRTTAVAAIPQTLFLDIIGLLLNSSENPCASYRCDTWK